MSVIVKIEDRIILYIKGADNVILERLSNQEEYSIIIFLKIMLVLKQ